MTKIIVGAADQSIHVELRNLINEIDGIEIVGFAESTQELSTSIARIKPEVAIVHDQLGPDRITDTVRDLTFRAPATAVVVIDSSGNAASAMAAMEAGARFVLATPLSLEDLRSKISDAVKWAERMGGLLAGTVEDSGRELGRRGRVTVFAGSKGGVGTTTLATHMALDLRRRVPSARVCLVDLDLQAGDVASILESRQRVSIADVARVSEDLSASTILDALVAHKSGVSLLLAPMQVQESEHVTPTSVRAILHLLRSEFDAILVDGGSHVSPAQAAAVEVADEVVGVVTPDVLSMRGFRRCVQGWEGLGVRTETELRVVVNRCSREDVLNADSLSKLTSASIVQTRLPAMFRRLERAVNGRDPQEVRESVWWTALEAIGADIGVYQAAARPAELSVAPRSRPKRSLVKRAKAESGQIALENVVLVPLVILICLLIWQLVLIGLALNWNSNAANAAARAYSIGNDPAAAARDALPDSMRDEVSVQTVDGPSVRVTMHLPLVCPGCAQLPKTISQTVGVVKEP